MAHSAMHFGIGLAVGAASGLPFLWTALKEQAARNSGVWLTISYVLGAIAVFPSFLGMIGVPESVTSAWYMNIFLFHPLMDRLKPGGKLIGETLVVTCFLFQYSMMLLLLHRAGKKKSELN